MVTNPEFVCGISNENVVDQVWAVTVSGRWTKFDSERNYSSFFLTTSVAKIDFSESSRVFYGQIQREISGYSKYINNNTI